MRRRSFRYPFLVPHPPRLSEHTVALQRIERSGWYTNFGVENLKFERLIVDRLFGGVGHSCTVSNATLGLMIAVKDAVQNAGSSRPRYAILPSFTFAATAQAAHWCGLTPLFCDIDPETWLPDLASIERLLRKHGRAVGVVIPYATFGNNLRIRDYAAVARRYNVGIVVDAAASLGSSTRPKANFGTGSEHPVVYSMHATKTFATLEAGLIYSRNAASIQRLRRMSNFGFDDNRTASLPGLNAKLTEVGAVLALAKLRELPRVLRRRSHLVAEYQKNLRGLTFQRLEGTVASQFMAARLDGATHEQRDKLVLLAAKRGVEIRTYFSPPLHEQPFFAAPRANLPVTNAVARDIISLPLHDGMTSEDVQEICSVVNDAARNL